MPTAIERPPLYWSVLHSVTDRKRFNDDVYPSVRERVDAAAAVGD